jgi:hypothetical protein
MHSQISFFCSLLYSSQIFMSETLYMVVNFSVIHVLTTIYIKFTQIPVTYI